MKNQNFKRAKAQLIIKQQDEILMNAKEVKVSPLIPTIIDRPELLFIYL
ncbi:hypothetical protein [Flammeovirga sp. EKP202]|nr:hypothetical protein [Flammeovirga sp. EKP202]MBD0405398.1 hypothetical protein [Flammeovirga sp. EKP202]